MTDDQRKKYEEAAKEYVEGKFQYIRAEVEVSDVQAGFLAGASYASQDTEERVKQAHNAAIDKALAIVNDAYTFDREDKIFAIEDEIQKLKL